MAVDFEYYDVAIVGGGVSGTMVAVNLVEANPSIRVLLVEKGATPGPGLAYGTGCLEHLLNVPAGKMGMSHQNPEGFYAWILEHRDELGADPSLTAESFVPRNWYGRYVRDGLARTRARASCFDTVQAEITDLELQGEFTRLLDAKGRSFVARKVVLALGNFPPGDPPLRDQSFHRSDRYLTSPWEESTLRTITNGDPILILGAGLTALDLLVSLSKDKGCGSIHVLSRRGLFPQPHEDPPSKEPWIRERELPRSARGMLRLLRSDVRHAGKRGVGWRAVVDSLRPCTQQVWQSFSILERRRFMRHLRPYWESHRHRAAPEVLAIKDALIKRGQLTTHAGRIKSITAGAGGMDVTYFDARRNREESIHAGFVINCTGPECNYQKLKDPLIVNLLARGLAHPDPLFLGLMTGPQGALLNYLGQPSDRLFTLGSVQKGVLYETTAMPELRTQAKKLAAHLLGAVSEQADNRPREESPRAESKVVIVSNRGPNDFVWREDHWELRAASGGLVSMIEPLAQSDDVAWFCCVSEPVTANDARGALFTTASDQNDARHHLVPIPLPARVYKDYYGTISNEVLWMLQHHLVGQFGYSSLDAARHRAWDNGYLEANRRLLVGIRASGIQPKAFLVQDYHLYPLPALLRQTFPNVPCLHFTHIPFPDAAMLKLIPQEWRTRILEGLLGADVVGMQTVWDVRRFLGCCEELLNMDVDRAGCTTHAADGRRVRVMAFPASADPEALARTMRSAPVDAARQRLKADLEGRTIIRVDRLDPTKNQVIGFEAFGRLLEMRPDLRGQVRFLAFLVPSRTDLSVYREYRDAVYKTIAEVNARFASDCGYEPIKVFYTNDREQALAAMESCDVLLVNSREDGMNLVVKEWAVISTRPGVAIISETAGVAMEMGSSTLLVSPLDIEGTALALERALEMPAEERMVRLRRVLASVHNWTSADWLSAQLSALNVGVAADR